MRVSRPTTKRGVRPRPSVRAAAAPSAIASAGVSSVFATPRTPSVPNNFSGIFSVLVFLNKSSILRVTFEAAGKFVTAAGGITAGAYHYGASTAGAEIGNRRRNHMNRDSNRAGRRTAQGREAQGECNALERYFLRRAGNIHRAASSAFQSRQAGLGRPSAVTVAGLTSMLPNRYGAASTFRQHWH